MKIDQGMVISLVNTYYILHLSKYQSVLFWRGIYLFTKDFHGRYLSEL